ncbi:MAG: phosphoglycerate mutase family protein [Bacteroidota bacterium]
MGNFLLQGLLKLQKILVLFLLLIGIVSCENENKTKDEDKEPIVSTFYLIRHAEKDRTDSNDLDPELNQKGLGRAIRWAEIFDKVELDAIFSTDYERTTMTAAPTSVKKNIDIEFYNFSALDVEAFKKENLGREVLVVGHSNTTPTLANRLLQEEQYSNMEDDDNSTLFIIRFVDDQATAIQLKMD